MKCSHLRKWWRMKPCFPQSCLSVSSHGRATFDNNSALQLPQCCWKQGCGLLGDSAGGRGWQLLPNATFPGIAQAHWHTEQPGYAKGTELGNDLTIQRHRWGRAFGTRAVFSYTLLTLMHFFNSILGKQHQYNPTGRKREAILHLVYPQQEWNSKRPENLFVEMCHCD